MVPVRVLLAGESWMSAGTHIKGFDRFNAAEYQTGIGPLRKALAGSDVVLTHMPGHLVSTDCPSTLSGLGDFDMVALSDIGANSLRLHPDTFVRGLRTPKRLSLIAEWVEGGGGFMMIGGYYTFQGINGAARDHRTPVEHILPVDMLPYDDRVEVPEGFVSAISDELRHPAIAGIEGEWPYLLGYNETRPKDGANVLLRAGPGPDTHRLLAAWSHGRGRTMAWTSDVGPHGVPTAFSDWYGYARFWRQAFPWLAGR